MKADGREGPKGSGAAIGIAEAFARAEGEMRLEGRRVEAASIPECAAMIAGGLDAATAHAAVLARHAAR